MSDVADLYRGPWSDFIARRDAMAKQMRAAGNRPGADRIKALRKPSRIAWALDVASSSRQYSELVAAVNATVSAQSKGQDVRDAMTSLRDAVRAFASFATDAAREHGQNLDRTAVINAVFAVLGTGESFQDLQRGELVEIPAAGGLDALATITTPALTVSTQTPQKQGARKRDASVPQREQREQRERELADAERQLTELRAVTDKALRALNAADADVERAERRAEEAANAVISAKERRDNAASASEKAMQRVREAEETVARQRTILESS